MYLQQYLALLIFCAFASARVPNRVSQARSAGITGKSQGLPVEERQPDPAKVVVTYYKTCVLKL